MAFAHDSFHVEDSNAAPTLQTAAAAMAAGDAPSQAGAQDTTGGTAEARAESVVGELADAGAAIDYTENPDTDQEADAIIAFGQLMQAAQQAAANAQVENSSIPPLDSCDDSPCD